MIQCIAKAAALIHTSATTYSTYLAAQLPLVTPRNFLDLLDTFAWLLAHLMEKNCRRMDRQVGPPRPLPPLSLWAPVAAPSAADWEAQQQTAEEPEGNSAEVTAAARPASTGAS